MIRLRKVIEGLGGRNYEKDIEREREIRLKMKRFIENLETGRYIEIERDGV